MHKSYSKYSYLFFFVILVTSIVYIVITYYTTQNNFLQLSVLYGFLFLTYLIILKYGTDFLDLKHLLILAVLFRILLFGLEPNLSEDYFRFIWDGKILAKGYNPYLYLPKDIISDHDIRQIPLIHEVYAGISELSKNNYTCYPPLNQFIFAFSSLICPHSIAGQIKVLRVIILLAEAGTLYFGVKILKQLNLNVSNILIYAFNPLVIIELTGNLHFEAVMIFLIVLSLYLLRGKSFFYSALAMATAASIKLIPLMFLPLLYRRLRFKSAIQYYLITGFAFLVLFLPFFSYELVSKFSSSVGLYFQNFEFNASIYYIIREIGYYVKGYNIIHVAGLAMGLATFVFVVLLSFRKQNNNREGVYLSMLFALTIYYFLATTVHPWYITTILILSCFSKYRYALVWTLSIIVSYELYSIEGNIENLWLILGEYLLVYGFMIYELISKRKQV